MFKEVEMDTDMGEYGCGVRAITATGSVIVWNNFTVDLTYPDFAYDDDEPLPLRPPTIVTYTEDESLATDNDGSEVELKAGKEVRATMWPLPSVATPVNDGPMEEDGEEIVSEVEGKKNVKNGKRRGKESKNDVDPSPAPLRKVYCSN